MAKHIVKCKICGKEFDLSSEQGVKCGARRYAHYDCYPEGELVPLPEKKVKVDDDEKILKDYIKGLYGKKANWVLINKQIKEFQKQYSLKGMKTTLVYFYEVKKNDPQQSNGGIGIIPYVYQDAYNYYLSIWEAQQQMEEGSKSQYTQHTIEIKPPQPKPRRHRIFKFLDE